MKILILGGYGVFGGRLAHLLSDLPNLHLIIAGRSIAKAQAFCEGYQGKPHTTPHAVDRTDIAPFLATESPDLIVDASGPFQTYNDPYRLPRIAIQNHIPYLDFADASDFVTGICTLDAAAKSNNTFALSGVSSFPVLTAAVTRELSRDMTIKSITGGIAPSPYAGIGLNVMRAVVGYAGTPVKLTRNGQKTTANGLTESLRYTIAPPGALPLRNTRFSLVDVPDLQVIPPEYPSLNSIWMGAGPVPESLHRILNFLAKLRARRLLPNLTPLSPLFYKILNLMRFGEHRGGMFIEVADDTKTRSWHLLAEGDDSPLIPSMAIEAIIRKMLKGEHPEPGARPATHDLTLQDYEALFARRAIITGIRETPPPNAPLYAKILGSAFDGLPTPLKQLHSPNGITQWSGTAKVTHDTGLLACIVATLFRFPKATEACPLTVTFTPGPKGELWQRNFNGRIFHSFQAEGRGRNQHLITEKFGPITVALALTLKEGELDLIPRRWSVFGIPMPKTLLPQGRSFEAAPNGAFTFNVEIRSPLTGLIVAYQGILHPNPTQ